MTLDPWLLRLLNIDSINTATYEEHVYVPQYYSIVKMRNRPVQNVALIDGVDATEIINYIKHRTAYLKTLQRANARHVLVTYTAWYDTVPADIIELNTMYQNIQNNKTKYAGIAQYKLGDESISFGSTENYWQFMQIFNRYRHAHVIW